MKKLFKTITYLLLMALCGAIMGALGIVVKTVFNYYWG